MSVTLLLFASYADVLGKGSVDVDVGTGATVADVIRSIRRLKGGERLPERPLVAVNERYATLGSPVADGDEVALIPPVAGG